MRTGIALGFICLGAILAFAVTGNTSVFTMARLTGQPGR